MVNPTNVQCCVCGTNAVNELMLSNEALDLVLHKYNFSTVLDVGSGQGLHADVFRRARKTVVTIDASNHWGQADIRADFNTHVFDEPFDLVWCSHVLEHQVNAQQFLQAVYRALKPGGILAITVPPAKPNIVGGHVSIWNAGLVFYNLILAGFDCREAMAKRYGYNISIVVRKSFATLPALRMDAGDIELIAHLFPVGIEAKQDFQGDIEAVGWSLETDSRPICGPGQDASRLDKARFMQGPCAFGTDLGCLHWSLNCAERPGDVLAFGPGCYNLLAKIAPRQPLRSMFGFDLIAAPTNNSCPPDAPPMPGVTDLPFALAQENLHPVPGRVDETLPMWMQRAQDAQIALLLFTSDDGVEIGSVLHQLNARILPGTVLVFDKFADWQQGGHPSECQWTAWQALVDWLRDYRREVRILSRGPDFCGSLVVKR